MKLLLDTNVVLDHMLARKNFAKAAAEIFSYIESGELTACLSATTITTIYYLATKAQNAKSAQSITENLMKLFEIAPVNRAVLENATHSNFTNFEDAVIHEAAICHGAQGIVTRDRKGFKNANLHIYTPNELLRILAVQPITI